MKTKTTYLILILLLPVIIATAQHPKRVTFGVIAGVNVHNLYGKDYDGVKLGNELMLGYHVGANIQIRFAQEFFFQPGLLYSTKGKEKYNNTYRVTTNLSYIELPLNLVYKTQLGRGYLMVGAGPYIAYAIMGKEKTQFDGEAAQQQDIRFKNSVAGDDPLRVNTYKALDAGGNVFFGGELAGVFAQLNIQVGLININAEREGLPDDKTEIKNTGFGLSLGYRF